jgi:hypothetical protein
VSNLNLESKVKWVFDKILGPSVLNVSVQIQMSSVKSDSAQTLDSSTLNVYDSIWWSTTMCRFRHNIHSSLCKESVFLKYEIEQLETHVDTVINKSVSQVILNKRGEDEDTPTIHESSAALGIIFR